MKKERRYLVILSVVFMLSFFLRAAYSLLSHLQSNAFTISDQTFYRVSALNLIHYWKYADIFRSSKLAFAGWPPGTTVMFAFFDLFGLSTLKEQLLIQAFLGSTTVIMISVIAKTIFDEKVGVIAGFVGVVNPGLFAFDAKTLAEPLSTLVASVVLLVSVLAIIKPLKSRLFLLGLFLGVDSLTRGETILSIVSVALPTLLVIKAKFSLRLKEFLAKAALVLLGFFIIISPWEIRNALEFPGPVLIATDLGDTFASSNNPQTFYGPCFAGFTAHPDVKISKALASSKFGYYYADIYLRNYALSYIGSHLSRLPAVILARFGRAFGVYHLAAQEMLMSYFDGWPMKIVKAYFLAIWISIPLCLIGLYTVFKKKREFFVPITGFIINVVLLFCVFYPEPRIAAISFVSESILDGIGIAAAMSYFKNPKSSVKSFPLIYKITDFLTKDRT